MTSDYRLEARQLILRDRAFRQHHDVDMVGFFHRRGEDPVGERYVEGLRRAEFEVTLRFDAAFLDRPGQGPEVLVRDSERPRKEQHVELLAHPRGAA